MVVILIDSIEAFSIHDQDLNLLAIGSSALHWFRPKPNTLGAWIDGWANSKTIRSIQEHAVQKVAFACAVLSCYRNNSEGFLKTSKEMLTILVNLELSTVIVPNDEGNSFIH